MRSTNNITSRRARAAGLSTAIGITVKLVLLGAAMNFAWTVIDAIRVLGAA